MAIETIYIIKTTDRGKKTCMALKFDISKAYNRFNWKFLETIICYISFKDKWICLIIRYIFSMSYLVLVHGKVYGLIKPIYSLKQGDPLSPYLLFFFFFVLKIC